MKKIFLFLTVLLLVAGCSNTQNTTDDVKDENDNSIQGDRTTDSGDGESGSIIDADEAEENDNLPLKAYFMKDGSVAHFRGEGNEYATYTARTEYIDENYVNVYENNGGTILLRTFRIEADRVLVVQENGEVTEEYNPSELRVESLLPLYVYLVYPIEQGTEFEGWTVKETAATVDTPFRTFNDVIVLEYKNEDGSFTRRSLAEGYGEIKREFEMPDGTLVTSTLERIE